MTNLDKKPKHIKKFICAFEIFYFFIKIKFEGMNNKKVSIKSKNF